MSEPCFRLRGIRFGYQADHPVLDGLDLTVAAGERLAVVGSNGSGKTTLLHLMVGLHKPAAGSLTAFGRERRSERDFHEVRARAGLLFQNADDQLFCPTVIEDVAFGPLNLGKTPAEARLIAEATLARLGLAGFADRVAHRLSGGEKRLVALATVLAMAPDVLLLDEPTAGLDEQAESRLMTVLSDLPQAMVIVSHDRAFRNRLATRVADLRHGRIHEGGAVRPSRCAGT